MILAFAPGERQLISYRSNPPPLPVGWYLGQYIDRCIIGSSINTYLPLRCGRVGATVGERTKQYSTRRAAERKLLIIKLIHLT